MNALYFVRNNNNNNKEIWSKVDERERGETRKKSLKQENYME